MRRVYRIRSRAPPVDSGRVLAEAGALGSLASSVLYPRGVSNSIRVPVVGPEPVFAHPTDAGADLLAAEELVLEPGRRALVGTGVRLALPEDTVGLVVPRSGLAARHGVTLVNAPGTIDSGYRGEIRVVLYNTDPDEAYRVRRGDRIAQLVVLPRRKVEFLTVPELPEGDRGEAGFGSSGYAAGPADADASEAGA